METHKDADHWHEEPAPFVWEPEVQDFKYPKSDLPLHMRMAIDQRVLDQVRASNLSRIATVY